MKHLIRYGTALILGLAVGAGAALVVLGQSRLGGAAEVDGWRTDPRIGAADADRVTRAVVARTGLLALSREETIYFTKDADDAARRFDPACTYEIAGGAMPARWWSLTLYAEDLFLAVNGDNAHSFDATRAGADAWRVILGPAPVDGAPWISTRNAGAFDVLIRFYNPPASVLDTPESIPFPAVTRLSCPEDGA